MTTPANPQPEPPPCSVCSYHTNAYWLQQGYKWCKECHRDFTKPEPPAPGAVAPKRDRPIKRGYITLGSNDIIQEGDEVETSTSGWMTYHPPAFGQHPERNSRRPLPEPPAPSVEPSPEAAHDIHRMLPWTCAECGKEVQKIGWSDWTHIDGNDPHPVRNLLVHPNPSEPPPSVPRPGEALPADDYFCQWCYDKGLRYQGEGPWKHANGCPFRPFLRAPLPSAPVSVGEARIAELEGALRALWRMYGGKGRGDMRKIEDALTWIGNENRVEEIVEKALANTTPLAPDPPPAGSETPTPRTDAMCKANGMRCKCADMPIELCVELERAVALSEARAEQAERDRYTARNALDQTRTKSGWDAMVKCLKEEKDKAVCEAESKLRSYYRDEGFKLELAESETRCVKEDLGKEIATLKAERDAAHARIAELEKDKARLDWLEKQIGGYPIQIERGRDKGPAAQNHTKITTGINSGPWQMVYVSPPGHITLRAAIDAALAPATGPEGK